MKPFEFDKSPIQLDWTGITIYATVEVINWYFNKMLINAKPVKDVIPKDFKELMSYIKEAINDNGFGVESLLYAEITIYNSYEYGKKNIEILTTHWNCTEETWVEIEDKYYREEISEDYE